MDSEFHPGKFRELLDESYNWPDFYEFKFIIKTLQKSEVLEKLQGFKIEETPSKKGNYVSISARKLMQSTDEVMEIYDRLSVVQGIMSL